MLNKIKSILYKVFIKYYGWLMILLFAIDLISKAVMENVLTKNGTIQLLPFFNLELVYNQGAFFGMMGNTFGHIILILISLAGGVGMIYLLVKYFNKFNKGMIWGLIIAIPGDLGNLVDRCIVRDGNFRGVIDFLHFYIEPIGFDWANFNVADMCLVVGVILFGVSYFIYDMKIEKEKKIAQEKALEAARASYEASKQENKDEVNGR